MTNRPDRVWQCPPRAVVAAVDFEPASARAVSLAGFIASACDATLGVLHADRVDAPSYFTLDQIARLEEARADAGTAVAIEVTRFARSASDWPVEVTVVDGTPVDAILHAADHADLLVLGTHGRRGPSRWWLGSVAERVVRGAPVPVLVTRAATNPLTEVFARVVLVGDGVEPDAGARDCVERLARAVGGTVVVTAALAHCSRGDFANGTLVAVAARPGPSSWGISDAVAEALGHCAHPALFLPSHQPLRSGQ